MVGVQMSPGVHMLGQEQGLKRRPTQKRTSVRKARL